MALLLTRLASMLVISPNLPDMRSAFVRPGWLKTIHFLQGSAENPGSMRCWTW